MKRTLILGSILTVLATMVTVPAATVAAPGSAFDRIKALAGEWKGRSAEGEVRVTYKIMSGGSVVIETLESPDEPAMVTVYHTDGDDLRMTHFCSAQNQPRMKAGGFSADARVITFEFLDATNLSSPGAGRMDGLQITFKDNDHIQQRWIWKGDDGKLVDNIVELARVN